MNQCGERLKFDRSRLGARVIHAVSLFRRSRFDLRRFFWAVLIGSLVVQGDIAFATEKSDCQSLAQQSSASAAHLPSDQSGRVVIGKGRLQFYSAPDEQCLIKDRFVIPGDTLDAYLRHGNFTKVLYMNPKTGKEAQGWVLTTRLKETGFGVGPTFKQ
ncbi:hypothetical protein AAKU67_003051 [Oxalobacteraceae bacterium GrIS 2.11]